VVLTCSSRDSRVFLFVVFTDYHVVHTFLDSTLPAAHYTRTIHVRLLVVLCVRHPVVVAVLVVIVVI